MSTLDEKLEQTLETGGAAQRTFRSLHEARGGAVPVGPQDGRMVVSICPMDTRSFWQHDGRGKWDAMTAQYTKLEE
jgi:hypothetical protein